VLPDPPLGRRPLRPGAPHHPRLRVIAAPAWPTSRRPPAKPRPCTGASACLRAAPARRRQAGSGASAASSCKGSPGVSGKAATAPTM